MQNTVGNEIYDLGATEMEADYRTCQRGWDCVWLYVQVTVFTIAFIGGIYIIVQLGMIISGQIDANLSI